LEIETLDNFFDNAEDEIFEAGSFAGQCLSCSNSLGVRTRGCVCIVQKRGYRCDFNVECSGPRFPETFEKIGRRYISPHTCLPHFLPEDTGDLVP
jgi:hypothetical protein